MHAPLIVVALALSVALGDSVTPPATTACRAGISRETTERLFSILAAAPAGDCKFEGVRTERTSLEARWSKAGAAVAPVRVVPRECAPSAAGDGDLVVEIPDELVRSCPGIVPQLDQLRGQLAREAPAGRRGSASDPLYRIERMNFAALLVIGLVLLAELRGADRRWIGAAAGAFTAALALRAALPFSLGNWYSEVMPASGPPPWMRFGPGSFALQSLLRDLGLWDAGALAAMQLALGAAAAPLLLGVLAELRAPPAAIAATLVLLVFAPFHARLSATTSEHVLASTLCLALLFTSLRAARTGALKWLAAAALLLPAVSATRVDMSVQALAVLAWPFLRDRAERDGGAHALPRPWMIAVMAPVALATLAAAYFYVVVPSRHPTPEPSWHLFALRHFLPQFWAMATNDPPWISLASVLLAPVGVLAMAIGRPMLCARVAGTLLIAFVASGRTFLHDELLGARYFLFAIPIFLIASGYALVPLLAIVTPRLRAAAAAVAVAGLAVWAGIEGRAAYGTRYAFEDEYAFARDALARLPDGCAVYQVQIRSDALPHDVDCCLDLPRSPLVLDFPALRFADLPQDASTVLHGGQCAAYYEGAACAIAPYPDERPGHEFARAAAGYFQPRCAAARSAPLEPVAEATASPRTTEGFFDARPPIRLYRAAIP